MDKRLMAIAGILGLSTLLWGCGGETASTPDPTPAPAPAPAEPTPPSGPAPSILLVQAQFIGKKPGPARLELWRTDGEHWFTEVIKDKDSSVFHKAMHWRDGILTIGAGALPSEPPKPG